ncbi:hypothetical protein ACRRTK_014345 [Alexandromys fortis]
MDSFLRSACLFSQEMVARSSNPGTGRQRQVDPKSSEQVPGQPWLHNENPTKTLSQTSRLMCMVFCLYVAWSYLQRPEESSTCLGTDITKQVVASP